MAQNPVWSIVIFLAGEVKVVSTQEMQELFVVRMLYCSSFRNNNGRLAMLSPESFAEHSVNTMLGDVLANVEARK